MKSKDLFGIRLVFLGIFLFFGTAFLLASCEELQEKISTTATETTHERETVIPPATTITQAATITLPLPTQTLTSTASSASNPAINANEIRYLVRSSILKEGKVDHQISLLDSDMTTLGQFEDPQQAYHPFYAHLSFDKNFLIFLKHKDSRFEIQKMDIQGSLLEQKSVLISRPDYEIWGYRLSPDQKWISFLAASGEQGMAPIDAEFQQIFLVEVDGSGDPIAITDAKKGGNMVPLWSPNGGYLAFSEITDKGAFQLLIYDVKTHQRFTLIQNKVLSIPTLWDVKWSPDSNHLLFVQDGSKELENLTQRVYMITPPTGEIRDIQLTDEISGFLWLDNLDLAVLSRNNSENYMSIYNIETKRLDNLLLNINTPWLYPFLFSSTKVGLFWRHTIWIVDLMERSTVKEWNLNNNSDIYEIWVIPAIK